MKSIQWMSSSGRFMGRRDCDQDQGTKHCGIHSTKLLSHNVVNDEILCTDTDLRSKWDLTRIKWTIEGKCPGNRVQAEKHGYTKRENTADKHRQIIHIFGHLLTCGAD